MSECFLSGRGQSHVGNFYIERPKVLLRHWVCRHQKGKTNLDFTEARDNEWQWQWHQLDHMQICISLQKNNHASTPPLDFYRPDALPAAQPTVSKH